MSKPGRAPGTADRPSRPPTMADVARLAGVSAMTVSRALRPGSTVRPQAREKILAAAAQLDYVLDSTAAGLSSGRTGFVAVTIPSINNGNFADTVRGITEGLAGAGLEALIGYTNYCVDTEERLIEQFLRRRPEAVVVTGGTHTSRCARLLTRADVTVVETWDLPKSPIDEVVGFSNAEAAKVVVEHLAGEGFRRIGFIGGDTSRDSRGADRRRGFVESMQAHGLDASRLVAAGAPPITMREGALAMQALLDQWPDTEAVMCVSDLSAFGAMTACQRSGRRVPDDVAIAGFGAYDLSEHALPSITTVDVSAYRQGRMTAEAIVRRVADGEPGRRGATVSVEPRLVVRDSTRRH